MVGGPIDARERSELCDLFVSLGPDAPTLCAGWDTLDLAAHLDMREHDPRAGLVILGGRRFAGLGEQLMARSRRRGFDALVARLRAGPPVLWRVPGLRNLLNTYEWFVHHEDVRRANRLGPRSDRPDLDRALWSLLKPSARLLLRRVRGAAVDLEAPGHGVVRGHGGGHRARLVGAPPELVLYLHGRRSVAEVDVGGDPDAVAALQAAQLGI